MLHGAKKTHCTALHIHLSPGPLQELRVEQPNASWGKEEALHRTAVPHQVLDKS